MTFATLAQAAVDAVFTGLGESVTYHPAVGAAFALTVVRQRRPEILGAFGSTEHRHGGALLEARAADFAAGEPDVGDLVVADASTYRVRSVRSGESGGLIHVLDCEPF